MLEFLKFYDFIFSNDVTIQHTVIVVRQIRIFNFVSKFSVDFAIKMFYDLTF